MKTWMKGLLGIGLALLLLLLVGFGALVSSGSWERLKGMGSGIWQMKREAEALQTLEKAHPYTPPTDGRLTRERVEAFLAVCERIQAVSKPIESWMEAHQGQQGDLGDAAKATGMMAELAQITAKALQEQHMGAREFRWIRGQLHQAQREAQEHMKLSPMEIDLLQTLKKASEEAGLSEALRQEIRNKVQTYELRIKASGKALSPNGILWNEYRERLDQADLGSFGGMFLESQGKRRRRGRTPTEAPYPSDAHASIP